MRYLYLLLKIFLLLILLVSKGTLAHSQDIPGATATVRNAPPGTLVIAMDNTNQATSTINPSTGTYLFNLKSYGLVTLLRNAGVYVVWAIKTGKAKDGIDFTTTAERIHPSYLAPQSRDFKAGPFVIFPWDTLGVSYLVDWFNSSLPDSCKVKVYRTTAEVIVDCRYMLPLPPRIALLHDSCDIHRNFLEMASVPTINYDCLDNASGIISGCYTIVTEPHIETNQLDTYTRDSIYNFVLSAGGNFLAQCEGVPTFDALSFYQSSTGVMIEPSASGGGLNNLNNFNNNVYFDNPDMAYSQFEGSFKPRTRGAIEMWRYASPNTNNFYSVVSCKRHAADNLYYTATVSKLRSGLGGLVFYLGNHEYYTPDCHTCVSGTNPSEPEINGVRLYLNAVQMPSNVIPCTILDIKLGEFTATKQNHESVLVKWKTLSETNNDYFIIEHSTDGRNFTSIGKQFSNGNNGSSYSYVHPDPRTGINYYRLRSVDRYRKAEYSAIRKVVFGKKDLILTVFPNPAKNSTTLMLDVNDNERLFVKLIDGAGKMIKQQVMTVKGQLAELDLSGIQNGLYIIVAMTEKGEQFKNKLIVNQ